MHNSPVTVFWGCWAAMICMSTLSSLMGAILPALLSQRTAHLLCAALFLGFGGLMLWQGMHMTGAEITEEWKEAQHEIQADEEEHEMDSLERTEGSAIPQPVTSAASKSLSAAARLREGVRNLCSLLISPAFSQAFLLSFLGEWGDRSQITTMALAATHRVVVVTIGTSFAHMACIVVAVSAGAILAQYLSPRHLTLGGAALFLLFGLSAGYEAIYEVAPPALATF